MREVSNELRDAGLLHHDYAPPRRRGSRGPIPTYSDEVITAALLRLGTAAKAAVALGISRQAIYSRARQSKLVADAMHSQRKQRCNTCKQTIPTNRCHSCGQRLAKTKTEA